MSALPEVPVPPRTGADVVRELRRVHEESAAYWRAYDTPAFFAPMGAAWPAADHVRHLTKSMRPLTQALGAPKLLLWLRFGGAKAPSRTYGGMLEAYHARLAQGASAGRFAPSPREVTDAEAERARIVAEHAAAVEGLAAAIGRWSEKAMDRIRLPHPALGLLTVREMLFFTVLHNVHHVHVAERRRQEAAGG